ncbi:e3 sumo-protein ligase mms21 [Quercus suber]|uniref:E3 sumo-protein ligase mms21 n=1 Tax=Quercus suber TaxID=58331 RepID=A0AAW0K3Y7_QUESU
MMKEVAIDLERDNQSQMVKEIENAAVELSGKYEQSTHFSSAIHSVADRYQLGPELTNFKKLFDDEIVKLKDNSSSVPENHPIIRQDGSKVFILQLGSNAHGSFLMIFELLHGHRKGSIIVPEGKMGSGWRGFGFHLRKAIAPVSLTINPSFQSVLNMTGQQFRQHKSFLSAAVDGDRKDNGGRKKGRHLMPSIQNSNVPGPSSQNQDCLSSQYQDLRDRGVGKVSLVPGADFMLEFNANASHGSNTPLSLELSLSLECGLNGKWDPSLSQPKPKVWRPKTKELKSLPASVSHPLVKASSLPSASSSPEFLVSDEADDARYVILALSDLNHASDVVGAEPFGSDVADEPRFVSASTSDLDSEEGLERDLRLILQEHFSDIVKKWGNSEQWVLELRDRRRVAVPIPLSRPRCVATEVLEDQKQLALVPWESSEAVNESTALFKEDEGLVEDWVLDSFSEDAYQPLTVEPLASSLPLALVDLSVMDEEGLVGVDFLEKQVPYSEWFQRRFNNFDSFLGMSLEGLEDQATEFLLAVEVELKRRAEVNTLSRSFKSPGMKGLRELKGLGPLHLVQFFFSFSP